MKHALLDTTFATQVFFERCSPGIDTLQLFPTSQTLNRPSLHYSFFLLCLPSLPPGFLSPQSPTSSGIPG